MPASPANVIRINVWPEVHYAVELMARRRHMSTDALVAKIVERESRKAMDRLEKRTAKSRAS